MKKEDFRNREGRFKRTGEQEAGAGRKGKEGEIKEAVELRQQGGSRGGGAG